MEEDTVKLFKYIIKTDARLAALQKVLIENLKLDEKEEFKIHKDIEITTKLLYHQHLEKLETIDPELAAKLLDDENPYLGFVQLSLCETPFSKNKTI